MKISIVITAYNKEKSLERAVSSCLSQTYQDIEVVIVDDSSTDGTAGIIAKLFKSDKRVKFLRNRKNLGPGLSRRNGIEFSTGGYVLLLDGDDYLSQTFIGELVKGAEETGADIVSGGIKVIHSEEKWYEESYGRYELTGTDKINKVFGDRIVFLNNRLVRRSLYDTVTYSARRYVEDTQTLVMLLYYANKVAYVPATGYNYVMDTGSLTHTADAVKDALYKGLCYKDILEFFRSIECHDYDRKFNRTQILFYMNALVAAINSGMSVARYYKDYVEFTSFVFGEIVSKK